MKEFYINMEVLFEKLTLVATKILGNPITFILALILVGYWWTTRLFQTNDAHQIIGDLIFGITFLISFIIQKSVNRYNAAIHLKLNELISSHDQADNTVIDTGEKTEHEIREQVKTYIEQEEAAENESKEKE